MRIADLLDERAAPAQVAAAGFDGPQAEAVEKLLSRCAAALRARGVDPEAAVAAFFVPGRIEVLGKHTDYLGGRSLLAAVERGFCVAAVPRADAAVRMVEAGTGEGCEFLLSPELAPRAGSWSNYPMTVARRVARNFPGPLRGAEIAFAGNLPPASGMSSSSALIVATFLALDAVNGLAERPEYRREIRSREALADYLAAVENGSDYHSLAGDRGVGTQGGSEDHTAILCARPGRLMQYSFAPVRLERVCAVPAGYLLAIASSGARAEKTGAAMESYNRAARLGRTVLQLWRAETGRDDGSLAAAAESGPDAPERLRRIVAGSHLPDATPRELADRLEQFLAENYEIVAPAAGFLDQGDVGYLSALVDRSQALAERLLGNQIPETVELARSARELGAPAASAFGAGFGGSVWALVPEADAATFLGRWRAVYLERFPAHAGEADFFLTRAGLPATRIA